MEKRVTINAAKFIAVLILVVSLWLMWKLQDNPAVFGLTSNIVAGYIFYVVIEFIPRRVKEQKAHKLLSSSFAELEHTLSKLVGVAMRNIKVDENDKVTFSLEKEYFMVGQVIWHEKTSDFILHFSQKAQTNLMKIIQSPLFRDLDEKRAEIIISLHTSAFLSSTLDSVASATEQDQNTIAFYGFRKGLEDTIAQHNNLFHKKPTEAREANFDEINIYNQRIAINRQMYKNEKNLLVT